MIRKYFLILIVFQVFQGYSQKFEELALTPPMGWNSWNKFGCNVSESLIMEMADAMAECGMRNAGYEYLVIDDCWQVGRDSLGNIIADPERFPSGVKVLVDYVHSKDLKFGIYSCAGSMTCQSRPGSRGYQFQDARTYASWGVDYLKYDWCFDEGQKAEAAYKTMSDALKASGRPIVFSICEWGESEPWKWGKGIGHLWRTTADIRDCYQCTFDWGGLGVLDIIDKQADLYEFAGPGHWNDPDMLEVGNGGMTPDENKTHFSMWAMLAAPLMAGNDLRNLNKATAEILMNEEVIAIDQDSDGHQARKFIDMGEYEIWAKPLADGEVAVCFLNRTDEVWKLDYDWKKQTMYFAADVSIHRNVYNVKDLWEHKIIGKTDENLVKEIPPHGSLLVRLSKLNK
ncbi:glycoside hydrolase family 27 protein [Labilibaculum sp. A4]|uniref:glycoside hydrolase family 27 protein n=1 Tax=Labilibaculum euxinus TaxID=2686357 RepID=UPI000F621185|nr:glycoside hydrolase family 27 protein [Labilibaculum euxinus]MDQ1770660.1 glycoside hydrolase family 27 protein [Labilibaculum euxinus]MWN75831.1 glycoside hydrolase family 27 protein [Labilibaculum euxinus]